MIHYIIQTIAFQLFFLIIYDFFLKKETFFNWNRTYLLGTVILSIVLPFIKIDSFKNVVSYNFVPTFPRFTFETEYQSPIVLDEVVLQGTNSSMDIMWYASTVLVIGCVFALLFFAFRVYKILKLTYSNPKIKEKHFSVIQISNSSTAFSFFNYVFLGEKIETNERQSILQHELVHIKQKHSWDLLFFEALRIVFWFNPLVYIYQNRISDLHEFIADSKAVKHNKRQYYENLLSQVFDTRTVSFINSFFKESLIKKRIIMLQKSKSKKQQLLKFVLLIPIVLGMLVYVSCSDEVTEASKENIDLSKYGYTLKIEDNGMVEVPSDKHQEYETFLKSHPEYVSWAQVNKETNEITYSVHSKAEEVPNNLKKVVVNTLDGESYDMYISLPDAKQPASETSSSDLIEKTDAVKDQIEIPMAVIDQVPVFPGCETETSNKERKACMNKTINEFIIKNFNTNLAKESGLLGVQQVRVFFKIGNDGNVKDIRARALSPELEAEAVRVVSMLPTMIAGEHDGKKVSVPYYLPIKFKVQE